MSTKVSMLENKFASLIDLRAIIKKIKESTPVQIIGALIFLFMVLATLFPDLLATHNPYTLDVINRLESPSLTNLMGTDESGRDIYSRVIYGARYSLGISFVIVFLAAVIGGAYGTIAGYVGGYVETVMMRMVDLFLSFPYLILAMAIASVLGRGVESTIIALTIVWWPGFARMVRGQVLSIKENLFVEAARSAGLPEYKILYRHIVPHFLKEVRVKMTLDLGYCILALTGLSFLGLGVQSPIPEWGLMISHARMYVLMAWWYGVFPGLAIFMTVLSLTLISEK